MRSLVVHVDLALQVLALVCERETVEIALGAGAGEFYVWVDPNDPSPEADHEVLQRCVAVDARLVCSGMHGVIFPLLNADHREA